jgi:hypothetical protein
MIGARTKQSDVEYDRMYGSGIFEVAAPKAWPTCKRCKLSIERSFKR